MVVFSKLHPLPPPLSFPLLAVKLMIFALGKLWAKFGLREHSLEQRISSK